MRACVRARRRGSVLIVVNRIAAPGLDIYPAEGLYMQQLPR